MSLVVDASVVYWILGGEDRLATLGRGLVAPPLMWSEWTSSLHEGVWRRELHASQADALLARARELPIARQDPAGLHVEAWRIADELGWAKTYDAEYLALARLLERKVVTLDARLRRGADRLGLVTSPAEL